MFFYYIRKFFYIYGVYLFIGFSSYQCAYFNTFYNAEQSFSKAVKIIQNKLALNGLEIQFQEVKSQDSVLEKIDLEYDELKNMISLFEKINGKIPLKLPIIEEINAPISTD